MNIPTIIPFLSSIFPYNMSARITSTQICANLHNSLVQRLPHPMLVQQISRDLVPRLQTQQPDLYNDLEGTRILEFLSLIDNYDAVDTRLTPQVRKSDPKVFLDYRDFNVGNEYRDHILLYPNAESGNSGGVIYDTATDGATWAIFPPWPRADEWVPLEVILSRWVEQWDSGKFYWDDEIGSLAVRSWVPKDVDDAVKAWDGLMGAISARLLPISSTAPNQAAEPILHRLQLERAMYHPFATAFLSCAARPMQIKWIAPGISIWTHASFAEAVEGEPNSSARRRWINDRRFEPEQIPVLLFPALTPGREEEQPNRVADPAPGAADFDKEWGFGKFTLDRRAGLYLFPHPEAGAGDGVIVLKEDGNDDFGQRRGRCPWGPGYPTRLAEMLEKWKNLVEDGTWRVGEEGVEGEWR